MSVNLWRRVAIAMSSTQIPAECEQRLTTVAYSRPSSNQREMLQGFEEGALVESDRDPLARGQLTYEA